ncbi:MAG: glycosyltransferase family 2 protein [Bacteroidetes bacterium]|nr:glycosyltransferase family 2 protein [Bacteroidota bacterium]
MFANKYLEKQNKETLINSIPNTELGMIVVIPCFREPDILQTLDSLNHCKLPVQNVEVIILINHSEIASEEIKSFNRNTIFEIENWISENQKAGIQIYAVGPIELKKKWAGAGVARKSGMDEAIRRLNLLEKPNGIIVSLDADTLVDENYLVEIENHFKLNPKNVGATISFQHQISGLNAKQLVGIQLYEKYLEYYKNALEFTGYPFSMFTVGSAFAVTAGAYVKRGGMNRRQAGEDFYFLQNLVQLGKVGEITSTKVYPSARLSDRVPFGTGPILQKWMNAEEDLTQTYNFNAFNDLKQFFKVKGNFYKIELEKFELLISNLPQSVQRFLVHDLFWNELNDLNRNCATLKSFENRFFQKFNAFKILKFLNFTHEHFYEKVELAEQIEELERSDYLKHS